MAVWTANSSMMCSTICCFVFLALGPAASNFVKRRSTFRWSVLSSVMASMPRCVPTTGPAQTGEDDAMEIRVGPPTVTIHNDDEFAVSEFNGEMSATKEQGYFVADTRLVSGYRLKLGRVPPLECNGSAVAHHSARFEFTNRSMLSADGTEIPERWLHLRLDRVIGHGVHEDYDLTNYWPRPVVVDLEISVESDFADLFDVKAGRRVRRGSLQSAWDERRGRLVTRYRSGEFERGLMLEVDRADSPPEFANGGILFRVALGPGQRWRTCVMWRPILGAAEPEHAPPRCHDLTGATDRHQARRDWVANSTRYITSDPAVTETIRQAVDDLAGMRMHRHDEVAGAKHPRSGNDVDAWVPAAGIQWFVSLFGRDSLTVSMQTLSLSSRFPLGSLRALGTLQADGVDDARDMQPGKIEHEIRYGELAARRLIPHTPYYGTHEATSMYVLVAARAWRWHGDRAALDTVRPHVDRALAWIDADGDIDGDGLQEYRTRSPQGYYNQGWKDAGDAITDSAGRVAALPIALCEHQGLVVAAKRAWADVLEQVYGDNAGAGRLRDEANRLADAIEARFW